VEKNNVRSINYNRGGWFNLVSHIKSMKFKKDKQGNEYTSASGAADYLEMPRTTFLYFYDKRSTLHEEFKPKYKIRLGKMIWYKNDLDEWKNKTANIKFSYKKRHIKPEGKVSNISNISDYTKPPK
tara:strand:- start:160 stop:537 length:378 start_codon:yes stop_codon:yes gene_type:complete